MKTVFLLRHGKAEAHDAADSDFERGLTRGGADKTTIVAETMQSRGMVPALIISSPAARAIGTAQVFARTVGLSVDDIRIENSIYNQDEPEMLRIIRDTGDAVDSVMLVGHDPSFTRMARFLASGFRFSMPKSGILAVEFAGSWDAVGSKAGQVAAFEYPRD